MYNEVYHCENKYSFCRHQHPCFKLIFFFKIVVPQVGLKNLTYRSPIDKNNNNTDYLQAINATQQLQGAHIQQHQLKSNSMVNGGLGGSIMDDFFKQLNGTTSHMANFTQPAALVGHMNATTPNAGNSTNAVNANTANTTNGASRTNTTVAADALSPVLKNTTTVNNKTIDHSAPHIIKITRNGGLPLTPPQQNQQQRNLSSLSSGSSSNKPMMNSSAVMNNFKNNGTRTSLFKGNTTKTVNGKETFYYKPNNSNSSSSSTNTNRTFSANGTLDFNHNNMSLGFNNNNHTNKNLNLTNRNVRKSEIPHPSAHHLVKVRKLLFEGFFIIFL